MPIRDFNAQRLFTETGLVAGARILSTPAQAHYLAAVLRLRAGESILLFNGRDGEWRATLGNSTKRGLELDVQELMRPQESGLDLDYLFAPLKRARLDYVVQKAVEMGVARLRPVITRRTVAERVNVERMRANVIEAAEQCGILRLPDVLAPEPLQGVLASWDESRRLVVCDEAAEIADPIAALRELPPVARSGKASGAAYGVLIGPEGGFAPEERAMLLGHPAAVAISLGPRVMRADTAGVAALALVNAVLGDWR